MTDTITTLVSACLAAGADPELVFQHLDDEDLTEYGRHLAAGHLPEPVLRTCMVAVLDASRAGTCSCTRCRISVNAI